MKKLSEDAQESLDHVKKVISNYEELQDKGELEKKWIDAYVHATCFRDISYEDLKKIFDACDKEILQAYTQNLYGLPERTTGQQENPFTLFRGCIGSDFRPGMSWTTCLYQAIKYPKRSKLHQFYSDNINPECSVWVALVKKDDIYCYINQYEPEFIVCPQKYWKLDIPQDEFQYEREALS